MKGVEPLRVADYLSLEMLVGRPKAREDSLVERSLHVRTHHLKFDEQLAAEAAFRGWPLALKWSAKAQAMYHGILEQTRGRDIIEEPRGIRDEAGDDFVVPPRVTPAIDLPAQSGGNPPRTKHRKV